MKATSLRLLQAAGEIVGGHRALARHLGIGETLLTKFMAGGQELPDPLLLRAVDIILADRQLRPLLEQEPGSQGSQESPS